MMEGSALLQSEHNRDISVPQLHYGQSYLQKYRCSYCARMFQKAKHLKQHMHIHTGERPHVCKFCSKAFTQLGNLQRHIRIHTGEKPFKCDFCDYRASQSDSLKMHVFAKHKNHYNLM